MKMSQVQVIEGIIMLLIGMTLGVYTPIGIVQLFSWLAGTVSEDPSKAFIPLFILAVAVPSLWAAAIRKLKVNRHAWWISPMMGFNLTFCIYVALATVMVPQDETWKMIAIVYVAMLLISILTLVPDILPPVKKHPRVITEKD